MHMTLPALTLGATCHVVSGHHCLVGSSVSYAPYSFLFFFLLLTFLPIFAFLLLRKELFHYTPAPSSVREQDSPRGLCLWKKKSKRMYLWKWSYSYLSLQSVPVSRIRRLHSCYLPTCPAQANSNPGAYNLPGLLVMDAGSVRDQLFPRLQGKIPEEFEKQCS